VFIAAGTGIAPLRAMMREALAMSHREVLLLYSARTPDDFAYQEELDLMARHGRIQFRQTITRDDNHCGSWTGGRGRISVQELRPLVRDRATLWFICGPGAFVVDTVRLLQELGVTRERIVTEEWAVRPASLSNIATSDITRPAEHSKQDGLLV
jgi:ferredoxin-NADP reductase